MVTDRLILRTFTFRGRRKNLPWFPRRGTRYDLALHFSKWGLRNGVEVGTYKAQFASFILKSNPGLHLTCVDPWAAYSKWSQEREDRYYADAMLDLRGLNVSVMRKPSLEAVGQFSDSSIDFVLIDGDHTFDAAIQDLIKWTAKVRPGGLVMVHDYWVPGIGRDVTMAVDAYTHCHGISPWYITNEHIAPTAFWVRK